MKKLIQLTVLFAMFFGVASAQNPMVFEPLDAPVDTGEYDKIKQQVLFLDGEEILVYFGAFEPIAGYAGTNALYYIDGSGKICTFPSTKNFTTVYKVINDADGSIIIGTDNGMYELTTSGWSLLFETFGKRITLLQLLSDGNLIFVEERDPVNPDFTFISEVFITDAESKIFIADKHALARGFAEISGIGIVTFSLQDGHIKEESDYMLGIDIASKQVIDGFEPPFDEDYSDFGGGYGSAVTAYGQYRVGGMKVGGGSVLISFDGTFWREDTIQFTGELKMIGDAMYTGPYKVNPDLTLEAIPVIGDQMVFGELEWFDNTWYISGLNLSNLPITNVTCSMDSIDIQAYLPSCLARIAAPTSVVDMHEEQQVLLYPNPANAVVHVDGMIEFFIFDQAGLQVSYDLVDHTTVNTENFLPGIYYVVGKDVSDKKVSTKFIVQH